MRTTKDEIREMADACSWQRGIACFLEERVSGLLHDGDTAIASVQGELLYRVRLSRHDGRLLGECSCPVGLDGDFCKHCVAVGLACAEDEVSPARDGSGADATARRPTPTDDPALSEMNRIRQYLSGRDSAWLVEKLIAAAENDLALLRQLRMEAAQSGDAVDMRAMKRAITDATRTHGFVDYRESPDFARGIHAVVDSIAALLEQGWGSEVIELSEHALRRVERALMQMDDSAGYMSPIMGDLQNLHHAACLRARPDPVKLARRLFKWELDTDWDTFYGAAETYADVLGKAGLAEYRRLAEAQWREMPQLEPGQESAAYEHPRFRLTAIMEALARASGDVEALVAVMSRNLSSPYQYLEIAEACKKAGMAEKALAWAEEGVRVFPETRDDRLRGFQAAEYNRLGRAHDAVTVVWRSFLISPGVKEYEALKQQADCVGEWPRWRDEAIASLKKLRGSSAKDASVDVSEPQRSRDPKVRYGSQLVEILIWEGDTEAAWAEASEHGCARRQWLDLARLRETSHPEGSLPIYQAEVLNLVRATGGSYEEPFELVKRIRALLSRMRREDSFQAYVAELRAEFRRKRNFMRLLDSLD